MSGKDLGLDATGSVLIVSGMADSRLPSRGRIEPAAAWRLPNLAGSEKTWPAAWRIAQTESSPAPKWSLHLLIEAWATISWRAPRLREMANAAIARKR